MNILKQASLQTRRGSHLCGSTLITWDHLLTAAHCVTDELTGAVNPISQVYYVKNIFRLLLFNNKYISFYSIE